MFNYDFNKYHIFFCHTIMFVIINYGFKENTDNKIFGFNIETMLASLGILRRLHSPECIDKIALINYTLNVHTIF